MAQLLAPFAGEDAPRLAEALRRRFGSLGRALQATPRELGALEPQFGAIGRTLVAARELVEAAQRETLVSGEVDPANPQFHDYLRARLCQRQRETLLVVFCGSDGQFLLDEEIGWGSSSTVRLDMAQLFQRALSLEARSLLLAHNHPSGECRPSEADKDATRRVVAVANELGISVLDHLIVTTAAAFSMRAGRLV